MTSHRWYLVRSLGSTFLSLAFLGRGNAVVSVSGALMSPSVNSVVAGKDGTCTVGLCGGKGCSVKRRFFGGSFAVRQSFYFGGCIGIQETNLYSLFCDKNTADRRTSSGDSEGILSSSALLNHVGSEEIVRRSGHTGPRHVRCGNGRRRDVPHRRLPRIGEVQSRYYYFM